MASSHRAFVLRHTHDVVLPDIPGVHVRLTDDILALWRAVQEAARDPDAPVPYWAAAWSGGIALSMYLQLHPELVAGRRVFDLGTGSGLVAITAARAGADVTACDIDPFAEAAVWLNARSSGVKLRFLGRDVLALEPPDCDVLVAGDTWYEAGLADRVFRWLRAAQAAGIDVLIGDPGRRYLPTDELELLATYKVRTTTELEDLALDQGFVYRLRQR